MRLQGSRERCLHKIGSGLDVILQQGHTSLKNRLKAEKPELAELIEACDETIPFEVCEALAPLVVQLRNLDEAIARVDRTIANRAQQDETARRLMSIPGFGPITASAMAATIQDTSSFAGPREFAAYLGLTPKQSSSGGKPKLRRISKMGNRYLRKLLVVGAHAVLFHHKPADVGEEADREEALQACRCGARQQDGAHRLRDPAEQDGLSGNSGVAGVGRVRGLAQQEPGGKGIEGDQEVMPRKAD